MNIRPMGNNVLVRPDPLMTKTPGGLFLPEAAVDKPMNRTDVRWCTVLAVGPGKWLEKAKRREPPPFGVGDRVLVNAWVGDQLRPDRVQNDPVADFIIDADDIFASESPVPHPEDQ